MSVNKLQFERFQIYDRCFRDIARQYTKNDLIDLVEQELDITISGTTFQNDINQMRKVYFPGVYTKEDDPIQSRKPKGFTENVYYYKNRHFSINHNLLASDAVLMLSQINGLAIDSHIKELCSIMNIKPGKNVISYNVAPDYVGLSRITDMYNAITNELSLELTFNPFYGKQWTSIVYPYHLRQYNNRWFLLGWREDRQRIQSIALDRIGSVTIKHDVPFKSVNVVVDDVTFDSESKHFYFRDIVGVTVEKEKPLGMVKLKFSKNRLPYIITKKIHPTQTVDGQIVSLMVRQNAELDTLILSFGKDVEVLEPLKYRNHIKNIIKSQMQLYDDPK